MTPALYIVATPIGNLDDMTRRAVDVLRAVDCIAAEDTRHSARLLQHYGIHTPVKAYHEFGGEGQVESVFRYLTQGKSVALISDAGTPLISDPGYRLVTRAHEGGIPVVPVPGASAMTAALSAAGLPTDRFCFEGFLPAKAGARRKALTGMQDESRTLVFYEAPHRIAVSLADMAELLGDWRRVTLARELSKTFETIVQKTLGEMAVWVAQDNNQQRGEIVLVVEGAADDKQAALDEGARRLAVLLAAEMPPQKASKVVADYCRVPKKQVYDYILSLKK